MISAKNIFLALKYYKFLNLNFCKFRNKLICNFIFINLSNNYSLKNLFFFEENDLLFLIFFIFHINILI